MMNIKPLNKTMEEYRRGDYEFNKINSREKITSLWYDWFCDINELQDRGIALLEKLDDIIGVMNLNMDSCGVCFKNNVPVMGEPFDDIRIFELMTCQPLFTIAPCSGYETDQKQATLMSIINNFEKPVVKGSWQDIKDYFQKNNAIIAEIVS